MLSLTSDGTIPYHSFYARGGWSVIRRHSPGWGQVSTFGQTLPREMATDKIIEKTRENGSSRKSLASRQAFQTFSGTPASVLPHRLLANWQGVFYRKRGFPYKVDKLGLLPSPHPKQHFFLLVVSNSGVSKKKFFAGINKRRGWTEEAFRIASQGRFQCWREGLWQGGLEVFRGAF